jgi:putative PIN family toxin of toxin-antitoxin system
LLRAFADDRIEVVVSPMLLAELERVLMRPKFRRYVDTRAAAQYVERIARHATVAADPTDIPSVVRDKGDDYLVALCRQEAVEVLVSGDADLLDAGLSDLTVLRPSELMDRLAAVLGAEGEAMVAAREALQETREGWAGVLALLGGYGYRPKLTSGVLVAYRGDGSTVTIKSDEGRLGHRYDDRELRATLRAADRAVVETASLELRESEEIVEVVLELLTRQEEGSARTDAFIRHFPPESNLARMTLTAAYSVIAPISMPSPSEVFTRISKLCRERCASSATSRRHSCWTSASLTLASPCSTTQTAPGLSSSTRQTATRPSSPWTGIRIPMTTPTTLLTR